jgi:1,4-alpha-glucan branching enzyme
VILSSSEFESILQAQLSNPHRLLGLHPLGKNGGLVARAFLKNALSCELVDARDESKCYPLQKIAHDGLFEGVIPGIHEVFSYRLKVKTTHGTRYEKADPYSFLPTLTEADLYLFNAGDHHFAYRKLGARMMEIDGVWGAAFAVWAPNAKRVSVVGDLNGWDGRYHTMRSLGSSGIWELFIPGIEKGMHYKYELWAADGTLRLKSDPYAIYFEGPPHNASVVWDSSAYEWKDSEWMKKRATTDWQQTPISIYEVHLDSWRRVVEDGERPLTYREMAIELSNYVKAMGFTHVEFMPVAEHPFLGSWGYQVTGFYAPTHRYGPPEDFMFLVDHLHQNDIGVIIDWVPAHFPKDAFSLSHFDGTHLYEHADPRQGEHPDWGTLVFNYARNEVRNFLVGSALSWLERYHIDGLRVDAVASMLYLDYSRKSDEWIPNEHGGKENIAAIEFLRSTNSLVKKYFPGAITIAEESTSFSGVTRAPEDHGGLGFDFKWNMGWMHDTLLYFQQDPIYRKFHHSKLTFGMLYQYSEHFIQCFSHDEVVHGKGSLLTKMSAASMSEKSSALRALYGFMWGWPGKKSLFMGCEFGQSKEWVYDLSLDWHLLQYLNHEGIQHVIRDLNLWYQQYPSLGRWDGETRGFEWVDSNDGDNSIYSFLRMGPTPEDSFLVIGNFTPVTRYQYRIGAPYSGFWKEIINTDASTYGGSGKGNLGGVHSEAIGHVGRPHSLNLTVPGMSTLILKYQPEALAEPPSKK